MGGQVQPRFARQVPPEYVSRAEDDGPRRGREVAETGQEEKGSVVLGYMICSSHDVALIVNLFIGLMEVLREIASRRLGIGMIYWAKLSPCPLWSWLEDSLRLRSHMQLSDLKRTYDNYLASNDGKVPSCIQMGSLLFDEFKGFVDPIMDNAEKYSIPPPGPRKYLWKGVEVIRDESVKPYQFRMGK